MKKILKKYEGKNKEESYIIRKFLGNIPERHFFIGRRVKEFDNAFIKTFSPRKKQAPEILEKYIKELKKVFRKDPSELYYLARINEYWYRMIPKKKNAIMRFGFYP